MIRTLLIGSSGYIGSFLRDNWPHDTELVLDTCDERVFAGQAPPTYLMDFKEIPREALSQYDVVLFFAGCSSVSSAIAEPWRAFEKNCQDPVVLSAGLTASCKLIYASSASVYSKPGKAVQDPPKASENAHLPRPSNPYDASKAACDAVMESLPVTACGLRMGTVSGWSPSLRGELVFNSMVAAASSGANVRLSNGASLRALLFLPDLLRAVITLSLLDRGVPPILNLASCNVRLSELATRVAGEFGVGVSLEPDSPTYSFALDTTLADTLVGPSTHSIESQARQLAARLSLTDPLEDSFGELPRL